MIGGDHASLIDVEQIRDLIHGFAHRDRGEWERLAALYAPDATVAISWFEGSATGFIAGCRDAHEGGQIGGVKHVLGHPRVKVRGGRALVDTDVTILMRVALGSSQDLVDVTTWCRFFHFVEKRSGRWQIVHWTAIYEKDRMDAVDPDCALETVIDTEKLKSLPCEFRSLAYVLHETNQIIKEDAIVAFSPEERELLKSADNWLVEQDCARKAHGV